MKNLPFVAVVILNWNGYPDTADCLKSLRRSRYGRLSLIVVDNGSTDGSQDLLKHEFPEVNLVLAKKNLGFTGGNNLGIEYALSQGANYVLLLNNDTVVDPEVVESLVRAGEANAKVGILGPKIYYFSDPNRIWYAGGKVSFWAGTCIHIGEGTIDAGQYSKASVTQFVSGCALMIKADVLRRVGFLDDQLFVYWEDSDFCMRARQQGYECWFVPEGTVWHKISQTCGAESPFTLYLSTRNHLTWVDRHVPHPYKLSALVVTLAKKCVKALRFCILKDGAAARATAAGITGFLYGETGPPRVSQPARVPEQVHEVV